MEKVVLLGHALSEETCFCYCCCLCFAQLLPYVRRKLLMMNFFNVISIYRLDNVGHDDINEQVNNQVAGVKRDLLKDYLSL